MIFVWYIVVKSNHQPTSWIVLLKTTFGCVCYSRENIKYRGTNKLAIDESDRLYDHCTNMSSTRGCLVGIAWCARKWMWTQQQQLRWHAVG